MYMNLKRVLHCSRLISGFLLITLLLAGLSGCFETKEDTPPKVTLGTVQGRILDSQTLQPIVGASVDLGGTVAVTSADGKYSIGNVVVPVDSSGAVKPATFKVTINLRSVTSPVDMNNSATTTKYPDFIYDYAAIQFTAASTSSTANPVTYLKENVDFRAGKKAATISGVVAHTITLAPVAAGYTVQLVALGTGTAPGGAGVSETVVGSTVTDANGSFTFANIEALKNYRIEAWDTAKAYKGAANVTSLNEGATLVLTVQANTAVIVTSTDTSPLLIVSVTPENNSDLSPAPVDVVYTFSKPILQTADTSTSSALANGLYSKVNVNYLGAKASNITHSLAWNSTFTQLTVSIPSLAAS